jgi:hypothetical protein
METAVKRPEVYESRGPMKTEVTVPGDPVALLPVNARLAFGVIVPGELEAALPLIVGVAADTSVPGDPVALFPVRALGKVGVSVPGEPVAALPSRPKVV